MPTKAKTAQPKTKAKDDKTAKKAASPKEEPKPKVTKEAPKVKAPKEEPKSKATGEAPKVKAPKEESKSKPTGEAPKVKAPKEESKSKPTADIDDKPADAPKAAKPAWEPGELEKQLSRAIGMVDTGKAGEAYKLFEAVAEEAQEKGHFGLAKVAKNYLVHKQNLETVPPEADPIQETVFLLNSRKPEAALEKIETMVKAKNASAHAYYLKALAHAGAHQLDLSAQSLKQAVEMDPALLNIYRLEPDFKACRRSSLFAEFELA